MRRTPKVLAIQVLAMTALVGGTAAFVSFDKAITLSVDGESRTMHTFANTVGELLDREDISIGEHDTVAPAPGTELADGTKVAVRYGRLLTLTVDGEKREVWVTATNVQEALEQLDLRVDGAYLSASRSLSIGRKGLALDIRTPHEVTFLVDGERHTITTTVPTVREAIDEAGITLGERDLTSEPLDSYPADGATIQIIRVKGKVVTKEVEIPFKTERVADDGMYEGEEKVVTKGVKGIKVVTLDVTFQDGEPVEERVINEKVTQEPTTKVVEYGTKERPENKPEVDDLNWEALADCESGGNPDAVNPAGPYYGLYQFSLSTWRSVGGEGKPTDYGWDEQTYRAQLLYKRSGDAPWPHCGSRLYS